MLEDTVAAISTPRGKGGVALLRVSGPGALRVGEAVFSPAGGRPLSAMPPRTAVYGSIFAPEPDGSRTAVDRGLAVVFRAPASYTGEDTVEITCHGGVLLTQTVLAALLAAGARAAGPGEFTRRAFLNGKIGLSEAAAEIAADCGAFCFGTLAQRSEASRTTLFALLKTLSPSCLKVFDANLRQNYFDAKILAESLECADMLKLNDSELPIVHGLLFPRKRAGLREMAEEIAEKFSLKFLACTLGAEGHIVFSRGEEPAMGLPEPVEVVDTVGAGDAFTAGFVSAILDGENAEGAARRAAKSAAYACSRRAGFANRIGCIFI